MTARCTRSSILLLHLTVRLEIISWKGVDRSLILHLGFCSLRGHLHDPQSSAVTTAAAVSSLGHATCAVCVRVTLQDYPFKGYFKNLSENLRRKHYTFSHGRWGMHGCGQTQTHKHAHSHPHRTWTIIPLTSQTCGAHCEQVRGRACVKQT